VRAAVKADLQVKVLRAYYILAKGARIFKSAFVGFHFNSTLPFLFPAGLDTHNARVFAFLAGPGRK
jgi:hypothetical protein